MFKKRPHYAVGLYAHITWHTWRRERFITEPDVPVVTKAILAAAARTKVRIHAMEVLSEHLHLVISYSPNTTISTFIREAKSESARRVNQLNGRKGLRWCRGFYANSLSRSHVRAARQYVARQHGRHPDRLPRRVG